MIARNDRERSWSEGKIPGDWENRKPLKRAKTLARSGGRGGWPFKEKRWIRWGDSMGNSAAFPVIVAKGYAPIGYRWKKVLLPNFRKILALARFSR